MTVRLKQTDTAAVAAGRRGTRTAVVVGLALLTVAGIAASDAERRAATLAGGEGCISAELHYAVLDGPSEYVLGPEHCLAETGWEAGIHVGEELTVPAAGATVGVGATVRRPPV